MPLSNTPIQRKLMVIILLITVATLLLVRLIFFTYEYLTFRKATLRQLSTVGQVIAANSTAALAFENRDDAEETLAALKAEPHVTAAALYDNAGHLFAKYPSGLADHLLPEKPESKGYHFEGLSLVGFEPVVQGNNTKGMLYLEFDAATVLQQWLRDSIVITIVVVGVTFAVAYLISKKLQKQISQPILTLAQTARAISERRDYSVRATKQGEDELGLLTDAFNQMLTRIQEQNETVLASEKEVRRLNTTLEQRVHERTSQLEAVNKELEAFSYSVSHDLRAPLRHISGYADMLRQNAATRLDETGQRHLGVIAGSAKQMGVLIDDLLVFSRMGRAELRRTSVKMDELVAEVRRDLAGDMEGRNISWDLDPLPEVHGDRALLKQVWANLLSNAVKYTRHQECATIKVACQKNDRAEWEFSVTDNGAGFDMQYVGKLFGVFQRLHLAEEFEGTGIGLANVQRIVLRHGGRVWAEGELDRGATFHFTLPNTEEQQT